MKNIFILNVHHSQVRKDINLKFFGLCKPYPIFYSKRELLARGMVAVFLKKEIAKKLTEKEVKKIIFNVKRKYYLDI